MSRQIMKAPAHLEVDHKSGNRLDMQRSNLRLCTHAQNSQNKRKMKVRTSSRYKGVYFDRINKNWRTTIGLQDVFSQRFVKCLGSFSIEEEAARAYDKAARQHFGKFAALNFPEEGERSCL